MSQLNEIKGFISFKVHTLTTSTKKPPRLRGILVEF